jgi:hypothetical protein
MELLKSDEGQTRGRITFGTADGEVLRLEDNGEIYVRGKLADVDKDVVEALRAFLRGAGHLK